MTNVHVSVQSDSTCAIAYVNNMGGIGSLIMDLLASELWQWCLQKDIFISASFIPGIFNVDADFNSRNFSDSTEWMIKKELFLRLCEQTFYPDVDLFASYINHQVDRFVSWFHNQEHGVMMLFLLVGRTHFHIFFLHSPLSVESLIRL